MCYLCSTGSLAETVFSNNLATVTEQLLFKDKCIISLSADNHTVVDTDCMKNCQLAAKLIANSCVTNSHKNEVQFPVAA